MTTSSRQRSILGFAVALALYAAMAGPAAAALPQQSGSVSESDAANQWFTSTEGTSGAGQTPTYIGDVNGDGIGDFAIGYPNAANPALGNVVTGAVYVIFGRPLATPAGVFDVNAAGLSGFIIYGPTGGARFGSSLASAGDVNGDHLADLVIGAPGVSSGAGAAYVIYGKTTTTAVQAVFLNGAGYSITGAGAGAQLGTSVAGLGDIDGDGHPDVAIGAPGYGSGAGAVFLVRGQPSASNVDLSGTPVLVSTSPFRYLKTDTWAVIVGGAGQAYGTQVAGVGDFSGDGHPDVAISARAGSSDSTGFVVIPSLTGNLATAPPNGTALFGPSGSGQEVGFSIASAGDFNADGHPDVVIGDPNLTHGTATNSGAAFVLYGGAAPRTLLTTALTSGATPAGFELLGSASDEQLGQSVAGTGDVGDPNSDPTAADDIVVGAPGAVNPVDARGEALVVFGDTVGDRAGANVLDESTLLSSAGVDGYQVVGDGDGQAVGTHVGGGGDVNGDSRPDVLVDVLDVYGDGTQWAVTVVSGYGTPTLAYPTINGQVGTSLSTAPTQLLRTGTATISAGQPLPAGLSLNASSGVISGVPQNPGTSTIPLSISDASGTGSALVTIVIAPQATTTTTTTTTTPPPPPPQGPPQITALAVSPRRFHPGARPTAITARKHGVTGTTITASVSEPATVTFRIAAVRATCTGHGRHKHCSKRYTGSLTRTSIGGPIRIAFSGRVGRHLLARGSYVLTATATGPDGRRGAPRSTRFTVL